MIRARILLHHSQIGNKLWCLGRFLQVHLVLKFPEKTPAGDCDVGPNCRGTTPHFTSYKVIFSLRSLKIVPKQYAGQESFAICIYVNCHPELNTTANFPMHNNMQCNPASLCSAPTSVLLSTAPAARPNRSAGSGQSTATAPPRKTGTALPTAVEKTQRAQLLLAQPRQAVACTLLPPMDPGVPGTLPPIPSEAAGWELATSSNAVHFKF